MTPEALSRPLRWVEAVVEETRAESARAWTLLLRAKGFPAHAPGQHIDLRLTAEDGYQAQRSYSIASAPREDGRFEITVQRLEDGEVSPFLTDVALVGDTFEVRGPIGGYFTWRPGQARTVLLVAGGSGLAPLMSMARTRRRAQDATPMRLLYSARTEADILYSDDLRAMAGAADGFELAITLTHASAEDWPGLRGLVDRAKLREHGLAALNHPIAYVCGPTAFVEFVASELSAAGMPDAQIKTERFGPSGAPQ